MLNIIYNCFALGEINELRSFQHVYSTHAFNLLLANLKEHSLFAHTNANSDLEKRTHITEYCGKFLTVIRGEKGKQFSNLHFKFSRLATSQKCEHCSGNATAE